MPEIIPDQKFPIFYVKDCALATMGTGIKAQTLGEFRDQLQTISAESVYHHFWRQSIETSLLPGEFHNDFSHWAHYQLHDDILAERLALLNPSEFADLEKLRAEIIEIIEARLDEQDFHAWCSYDDAFHFIKSKIVVFNTRYKLEHPKELVKVLPLMSRSSIFYHFIDARRREQITTDDFTTWLHACGTGTFSPLIEQLKAIDPYFISLSDLQHKLTLIATEYFLKEMRE